MSRAKRERNNAVQACLQWIDHNDLNEQFDARLDTVVTPRHLALDYLPFALKHNAPPHIIEALTPRWQREHQIV